MQLKLIVIAVAGVLAAPVFAQSNVIVYGRVSEAYSTFNHDSAGLRESQESSSRLGFKGTEEIGSDLSAFFALEHRFLADTGDTPGNSSAVAGGAFWGEKAYVGLQSKALGSVSFGKLASLAYSGMGGNFDAFGGDTIISNNIGKRSKVSNYFDNGGRYDSPSWGGFSFGVGVSTGEGLLSSSSPSSSGQSVIAGEKKPAYGVIADYAPGKLRTEFFWQHDVSQDNGRGGINPGGGSTITTALPNDPYNTTEFAVSYDFGILSVAASTARSKGYNVKVGDKLVTGKGLTDGWAQTSLINVIVPLGNQSLHFQYALKKEKAASDLNAGKTIYAPSFRQWGFGYWYSLSKRTTLLANMTFASQRPGVAYTSGSGSNTSGFGTGSNLFNSQKGLELGLRHEF